MVKKILIISPTPTHITTAGNRSRILAVCELLRVKGFEINFLLAAQEPFDKEALKKYWGENLFLFEGDCFFNEKSFKDRILKKVIKWFGEKLNIDSLKYNSFLDDYYPTALDSYIKQHLLTNSYDIVIVEYAIYSKALLQFSKDVLKLIDTHDRFSNRFETYTKNGLQPNWYSLFPREEFRGLSRADIVLAIQKQEALYFETKTKADVITLGHVATFKSCRNTSTNAIIFTASDNIINVNAINYFIATMLWQIIQRDSSIKLLIAGSICCSKDLQIPDSLATDIQVLGLFNETYDVYSKASVAINPVMVGTGLKIKVIEALAHGLPIVSFAKSNETIEKDAGNNNAVKICSTEIDFINSIFIAMNLSKDLSDRECNDFISAYNSNNSSSFLQAIS